MRSPTRYFLTTDQDAVPYPILSHRRSSLHDHPDAFVAQNDARFGLRHVPSQNVKVRPADRRLMDPDDYVRRKLQLWPRHSHPFRGFAHSLIHVRHHRARAVVDAVTPRLAHRRRLGLGFGRHHARTAPSSCPSCRRRCHSAPCSSPPPRPRLRPPSRSNCTCSSWSPSTRRPFCAETARTPSYSNRLLLLWSVLAVLAVLVVAGHDYLAEGRVSWFGARREMDCVAKER